MFFLTDSEPFYIYENNKSKKVHGKFGLGWKYQGRTALWIVNFFRFLKNSLFALKKVKNLFILMFLGHIDCTKNTINDAEIGHTYFW